jgi:hypothetical protein
MRALGLVATIFLAACSGSSAPEPAQRTSVAVAHAGDLRVELLTDARLEVGMTPLSCGMTRCMDAPSCSRCRAARWIPGT